MSFLDRAFCAMSGSIENRSVIESSCTVSFLTKPSVTPDIDLELFELRFPGKIIGKAVIDADAQMIGVIRNVRVQIGPSPTVTSLTVKGLNTEFEIKSENIKAIGNVVNLTVTIKHSEPIEVQDIIRLRNEIQEELLHFYQIIQPR